MTLEELTEKVDELCDMRIPAGVNASLSIHGLDEQLIVEWVEANPTRVVSRSRHVNGSRVAWIDAPPGRSVSLFEAGVKGLTEW